MINSTSDTLFRLSMLNDQYEKLIYQQSTGKELQYGSDNSSLYTQELHVNDRILTYEGLQVQISKTTLFNNSADSSLAEAKDLLTFVNQEVLKALNDTTDDESRKVIAVNLEGVKQNLYALANETVQGEYLFSGSDTSVKPFSMDSDGKVTYNSDAYLRKVAVEDGSYRERGVTGLDTFFFTSASATKGEDLEFSSSEQFIIDQDNNQWKIQQSSPLIQAGDGSSINISANQPLVDENGKVWSMDTSDPANIKLVDEDGNAMTPSPTIAENPVGSGSYDVSIPVGGTASLGTAVLTKFDENGLPTNDTLPVTKGASDNFKVSLPASADGMKLEAKENTFDVLDDIINALNKVDENGNAVSDDKAKEALQKGLENIQKAFDGANTGHAELGGRNKVFEISLERVEAKLTQYNILSQDISSVDLTEVAVKAKALELTFTSLYSTINKMNELALVNYIR